jgi:hypothetical protein
VTSLALTGLEIHFLKFSFDLPASIQSPSDLNSASLIHKRSITTPPALKSTSTAIHFYLQRYLAHRLSQFTSSYFTSFYFTISGHPSELHFPHPLLSIKLLFRIILYSSIYNRSPQPPNLQLRRVPPPALICVDAAEEQPLFASFLYPTYIEESCWIIQA